MKAIILSSLIFFSLRAMSTEVGQKMKPEECTQISQSAKRDAKKVEPVITDAGKKEDDKKAVIGK